MKGCVDAGGLCVSSWTVAGTSIEGILQNSRSLTPLVLRGVSTMGRGRDDTLFWGVCF